MQDRCGGRFKQSDARNYRDRGITVCERWTASDTGFVNFLADMGEQPAPWMSVERTDNDGNYEPGNCIWGTPQIQSRNKRNNVWIDHDGERVILQDACDAAGVPPPTLINRVRKTGMTHQEVFNDIVYSPGLRLFYKLFLAALAWVRSRPWHRPGADCSFAEIDAAIKLIQLETS